MGINQVGACCLGTGCEEDLNGDGVVNVFDLLILLGEWGSCAECPGDLNGDGVVNVFDLLILLGAWGACPNGASCNQVALAECMSEGGYFLGEGASCSNCPEAVICPKDSIDEEEPCGESLNNGCNLEPPAFGPMLTCGDTVCGQVKAENGLRDSDWFRITVTEPTELTWTINASFNALIAIGHGDCPLVAISSAVGQDATVSACVPPGEYTLYVSIDAFEGLPCGSGFNDYFATVTCDTCVLPTGACCLPSGDCEPLNVLQCDYQGGTFHGAGVPCSAVQCKVPPGPCAGNCGVFEVPDGQGGFCECDPECIPFGTCCESFCNDCPDFVECTKFINCTPDAGDCCEANLTPGCNNQACCEAVCECDAFCCLDAWDPFCSEIGECSAAAICSQCAPTGCPTVTCQNNENEPCGQLLNDGCNVDEVNPPFQNITCGQTICGNLWATTSPGFPNGQRDTDWFKFEITSTGGPVEVHWSVEASEAVQLFILSTSCPPAILHGPVDGCDPSIVAMLGPGQYIAFVAPLAFTGHPCPGFTYQATLECISGGFCEGYCGGGSPSGCFCDDFCFLFGDCCPGWCDDCPDCFGCSETAPGCSP